MAVVDQDTPTIKIYTKLSFGRVLVQSLPLQKASGLMTLSEFNLIGNDFTFKFHLLPASPNRYYLYFMPHNFPYVLIYYFNHGINQFVFQSEITLNSICSDVNMKTTLNGLNQIFTVSNNGYLQIHVGVNLNPFSSSLPSLINNMLNSYTISNSRIVNGLRVKGWVDLNTIIYELIQNSATNLTHVHRRSFLTPILSASDIPTLQWSFSVPLYYNSFEVRLNLDKLVLYNAWTCQNSFNSRNARAATVYNRIVIYSFTASSYLMEAFFEVPLNAGEFVMKLIYHATQEVTIATNQFRVFIVSFISGMRGMRLHYDFS